MKNIRRKLYETKFYIDVGLGHIGWINNLLAGTMATVYLASKFGIELVAWQIIVLGLSILCVLILFGYFYKHWGFFDMECFVAAQKNPVQEEMLKAARIITGQERK